MLMQRILRNKWFLPVILVIVSFIVIVFPHGSTSYDGYQICPECSSFQGTIANYGAPFSWLTLTRGVELPGIAPAKTVSRSTVHADRLFFNTLICTLGTVIAESSYLLIRKSKIIK
jgi:hypothetical protein